MRFAVLRRLNRFIYRCSLFAASVAPVALTGDLIPDPLTFDFPRLSSNKTIMPFVFSIPRAIPPSFALSLSLSLLALAVLGAVPETVSNRRQIEARIGARRNTRNFQSVMRESRAFRCAPQVVSEWNGYGRKRERGVKSRMQTAVSVTLASCKLIISVSRCRASHESRMKDSNDIPR